MAKKVLASDLVQENIFNNVIESADLLITKLTEVNKEFKVTAEVTKEVLKNSRLDSVKSINDLTKATENATKLQKEQLKVEQELIKAIALREKVQQEQLKTQQQKAKVDNEVLRGTIALTKEQERQQKATEKEIVNQTRLQSAYNRVNTWLTRLRNEYRDLAIKKELGTQLTAKEEFRYSVLEKRINSYDSALKKVDSTMGIHNRNVGNYASGWNGLSNSVNQLTREMPAFANSVQTGFMAISNNLPMFFDELQKIKKANVELKAQGIETKSALTQLGASIFSWGTALSLGVTFLTLYGAKMVDWISNALSPANKELEEMNKKMKWRQDYLNEGAKYIGQESSQYVGLILALKQTNKGSEERERLIKSINKEYGTTLKNISDETLFQKQLNTSVKQYLEYKSAEFKIKKNDELIALGLSKKEKLTRELAQAQKQLNDELQYISETKQNQPYLTITKADELERTKIARDIVSQLQKEIKELDKRLLAYGLNVGKATSITNGYNSTLSTTNKEVKELNTNFKDLDEFVSHFAEILNEASTIQSDRKLKAVNEAFEKELQQQITNAETIGQVELEGLEKLLNEEQVLRENALWKQYLFEEEERKKAFEKEYEDKQKAIEKEYDDLKEKAKGNKDALTEIEKNYLKKLEELKKQKEKGQSEFDANEVNKLEKHFDELGKIQEDSVKKFDEAKKEIYTKGEEFIEKNEKEKEEEQLKRKEQLFTQLNKLAKASADYFIAMSQNKIKAMDKELENNKNMQNQLQQLAINGNITAQQSLLQQEKIEQELQKKKEKELQKQQNLKLASSVFDAYSKNASNKDVKNPVVKTITDISVLEAFIATLTSHYDGTETTIGDKLGAPHLSSVTRDQYVVRVDKDEAIFTGDQTKRMGIGNGGLTTSEITKIAEDRRMGKLMYQGEGATQIGGAWQTSVLVSEIQGLRKAIEDKPVSNIEVGKIIGGVMHIVETVKQGNTTTRNRMRIS